MTISGFTFVKNATKLYIPAKQAIASILPLVDEFVVALGAGDDDDTTEQEILSLCSPKIKIVRTVWQPEKFAKNTIFAQQTDIAKAHCTGDWLFYIQCDEAVHERYLPGIREAAKKYVDDKNVEAFVFKYVHFWGDYNHFNPSHAFYKREIRMVRNLPEIHSWRDAQSFRYYENGFEPTQENYQRKENTRKLRAIQLPAEVYHYGWVRPPKMMRRKQKLSSTSYHGKQAADKKFEQTTEVYNYGPLQKMPLFKGTHPAAMQDWMSKHNWTEQLQYTGKRPKIANPEKHERLKYRIVTWLETYIFGGRQIGEFKNFELLGKYFPKK